MTKTRQGRAVLVAYDVWKKAQSLRFASSLLPWLTRINHGITERNLNARA
jgi:hypothetical protein